MSDITLVENLLSIDLLEPEKVGEICGIAAETIAAYSASYSELEVERDALQESEKLLMKFINDAYKSATGTPSKKTTIEMMRYVANRPKLQQLVNTCDSKGIKKYTEAMKDSQVVRLQAKIKQLEAQLEEERQENASLRSGDDYERWAE